MLYRSSPMPANRTGTAIEVTRARAGWRYVHFAVRQIAPATPWAGDTGRRRVLPGVAVGSLPDLFRRSGRSARTAPQCLCRLPPRHLPAAAHQVPRHRQRADGAGRWPRRRRGPGWPAQRDPVQSRCGFEIRGGGNATRQIVDIIPPGFAADRLLICEVFTPAGNWSSYPPHKHDVDRPPGEVKLEEIYYYRFEHPDAYGFQRLYDRRSDRTVTRRAWRPGADPIRLPSVRDRLRLQRVLPERARRHASLDGRQRRSALRIAARLAGAGSARAIGHPVHDERADAVDDRDSQGVSRRRRTRRRRPDAACRRSAHAAGRERRRQVDADEDPQRRLPQGQRRDPHRRPASSRSDRRATRWRAASG